MTRKPAPKPEPEARAKVEPFTRPPLAEQSLSSSQMFALSVVFALGATVAAGLAAVYVGVGCPSDTPLLKVLCTDTHYKYLVPLLVPVTAWFAIANWVGWQYFRYS